MSTCAICNVSFPTWTEFTIHRLEIHTPITGKLAPLEIVITRGFYDE